MFLFDHCSHSLEETKSCLLSLRLKKIFRFVFPVKNIYYVVSKSSKKRHLYTEAAEVSFYETDNAFLISITPVVILENSFFAIMPSKKYLSTSCFMRFAFRQEERHSCYITPMYEGQKS